MKRFTVVEGLIIDERWKDCTVGIDIQMPLGACVEDLSERRGLNFVFAYGIYTTDFCCDKSVQIQYKFRYCIHQVS